MSRISQVNIQKEFFRDSFFYDSLTSETDSEKHHGPTATGRKKVVETTRFEVGKNDFGNLKELNKRVAFWFSKYSQTKNKLKRRHIYE